jgi:hypothetical protein
MLEVDRVALDDVKCVSDAKHRATRGKDTAGAVALGRPAHRHQAQHGPGQPAHEPGFRRTAQERGTPSTKRPDRAAQ